MSNQELSETTELQAKVLADFHRLMLEALRQREHDVIRYIAILGPTLAGFVWLLRSVNVEEEGTMVFFVGTLGVIFVLLVGALYSVALRYNFRYITLQLAKLESRIYIKSFILKGWPRTPKEFEDRYGTYCEPPEIIMIFWLSFVLSIVGVTSTASVVVKGALPLVTVIAFGALAFLVALLSPIYYGKKMRDCCKDELDWNSCEQHMSTSAAHELGKD
jgi:hypothetical protein